MGLRHGDAIRLDPKFVWSQLDSGVIVTEEASVGVSEAVGNEKGGAAIKGLSMGCTGGAIPSGLEDVDNAVVSTRARLLSVMAIEPFLPEVLIFEWFISELILVSRFELLKKYTKFLARSLQITDAKPFLMSK